MVTGNPQFDEASYVKKGASPVYQPAKDGPMPGDVSMLDPPPVADLRIPHRRPHSYEGGCVMWGMPGVLSVASVAVGQPVICMAAYAEILTSAKEPKRYSDGERSQRLHKPRNRPGPGA